MRMVTSKRFTAFHIDPSDMMMFLDDLFYTNKIILQLYEHALNVML